MGLILYVQQEVSTKLVLPPAFINHKTIINLHLFLVKLLLLIHSLLNPVFKLHQNEDDISISASTKYELDLRSAQ